ncbi:MAG: thioesterase [Candidatus Heimdallarchaeota archaeon]|nr:thioesterase [Candidatus Heimdallarchaeota archaeon]
MDFNLSEGMEHTETYVVEEKYIADFLGSGKVAVLSTPSMILMMENTALLLAQDKLPEGWVTVGTRVDVSHLKPARKGAKITIIAKLKKIEKRHLTFSVKALANEIIIGEGIHERHIVNKERFMKKME